MGFNVGGGTKSEPSFVSKKAGELLLESFFPGTQSSRKGTIPEDIARLLQGRGGVTNSVLSGLPGVATTSVGFEEGNNKGIILPGQGNNVQLPGLSTGTSGPRQVNTGSNINTGTLLPSIRDIGTFNTLFEKVDAGILPESAQNIFNTAVNAISNPVGLDLSGVQSQINGVQAGRVEETEDIGTLTSEIFSNLPPQFQSFANNIFESSDPELIEAELDNLTNSLREEAELDAESLGNQLLSVFATNGATAGTAAAGVKAVATEIAIRNNSILAQARLSGLDSLLRARDTGVNLMQAFLNAGEREKAIQAQENIANLEAQTAIGVAKIQAAVEQTRALASVQVAQLGLTGNLFETIVNQSNAEENARIAALGLPFDILQSLATGAGSSTRTSPSFGANLNPSSGLASLLGGA